MDTPRATWRILGLGSSDLVSCANSSANTFIIILQFLFHLAETAQRKEWRALLSDLKGKIATVAIDEAHCIFEWLITCNLSAFSKITCTSITGVRILGRHLGK